MTLNPPQHDAVHTLSGPLLVLAGAGTGKTRVVTFRIAELIRTGTRAERILAVTFTNKAAAEMQQRAGALLKKQLKVRPEISTFHSLCVRILRRHIRRLGYPEQFAIYDRGDQEGAARAALRAIKVPNETLRPGDFLSIVSGWKSSSIRPPAAAAAAGSDKEHLAAMAYRRYQQDLKSAGAVDFDDLLLLTEELFQHFPDVRRQDAARWDHLLVDEYQDTNGTQYRIVRALAAGHRNLCVVGDDDQSIYGWRGAEVAHILRFKKDWPEAKVVRLEDNYRSTSEIIAVANRLIVFNKDRHDKVLRAARAGGERPRILQFRDEEEEAKEIVADIKRRLAEPQAEARHFAILFRTNEQPRPFETELRQSNLPYVLIGGMSFYDRAEVRDLLAYIKLLAHPRDEVSLLRIVNKPPRGLGQATVAQLTAAAVSRGETLWDVFGNVGELAEEITDAALAAIEKFRELVARFRARAAGEPLTELVQSLIDEIGYRAEIHRLYPNPADQETRWQAVEEVINVLSRYQRKTKKPTLEGFLEEIMLSTQDDDKDKESQLERNAIALMTLHSAKGLEFPQVYLVGLEEGILPHHRAVADGGKSIDEERRLCYVGVTRAQDRLTMSLSLTRLKWGKQRETQPSRFLFELTGQAGSPEHHAAIAGAAPRKPGRATRPDPPRKGAPAPTSAQPKKKRPSAGR